MGKEWKKEGMKGEWDRVGKEELGNGKVNKGGIGGREENERCLNAIFPLISFLFH